MKIGVDGKLQQQVTSFTYLARLLPVTLSVTSSSILAFVEDTLKIIIRTIICATQGQRVESKLIRDAENWVGFFLLFFLLQGE